MEEAGQAGSIWALEALGSRTQVNRALAGEGAGLGGAAEGGQSRGNGGGLLLAMRGDGRGQCETQASGCLVLCSSGSRAAAAQAGEAGERQRDAGGRGAATRTCRIWRDGRGAGTAELGADPRRRCLPAEGVAAGSEKLRERQAGGEERSRVSSTGPAGEVRRGEAAEPGGTRDGGSRRWRSSRQRCCLLFEQTERERCEVREKDREGRGRRWGLGSAAARVGRPGRPRGGGGGGGDRGRTRGGVKFFKKN